MPDELYRSHEDCRVSNKQRKLYYIHTSSSRSHKPADQPSTIAVSKASQSAPDRAPQDNLAHDNAAPALINPRHPPEICPPSPSLWRRLKEENEQRKNREVTRASYEEVSRISGRDERGFRQGDEEELIERTRGEEMRRGCCVM